MTPQLMQLIEETFEYGMTNVHTAFPAVVKSYDAETRRAEVQPSLKRKMSNGEFMDLLMFRFYILEQQKQEFIFHSKKVMKF